MSAGRNCKAVYNKIKKKNRDNLCSYIVACSQNINVIFLMYITKYQWSLIQCSSAWVLFICQRKKFIHQHAADYYMFILTYWMLKLSYPGCHFNVPILYCSWILNPNLQPNLVSKHPDPTLELTKARWRLCSNDRGVLTSAPTRSPESEEHSIWLAGISWYLRWFSQFFWSHLQCLFHSPLFSFALGTNSTLEPTKTHWRLCSMIEIPCTWQGELLNGGLGWSSARNPVLWGR